MKIPFFRKRTYETDVDEDIHVVVSGPDKPNQSGLPSFPKTGGYNASVAPPGSSTFPSVSSYPSLESDKAGDAGKAFDGKGGGWALDAEDPAKGVVYVGSQRNTNPLIIKERRRNRPIS